MTYAYAVVSVDEAYEVAVSDRTIDNQDRPFTVELGVTPTSVIHLSRAAAEALVDQLVAVLVIGGDPDASPPF